MTDAVHIALISALSGVPATIGGIAAAWFSYKASTHSQRAVVAAEQTQKSTDGMKDELVALTKKSSFAEGKLAGENAQHPTVEQTEPHEEKRPDEAKP